MISCDTNILFAVSNPNDVNHDKAVDFISQNADNDKFVIAEQVLVELYGLLRNPTLNKTPLSPSEAVDVVSAYRQNPSWALIDVPQDRKVMQKVWQKAGGHNFARRRIQGMRLAETLKYGTTANRRNRRSDDRHFLCLW